MAKTEFKSVDEYIASQPEGTQVILKEVRSAIRTAVPRAQEVISYDMPTYLLDGGRLLHFAVWKEHYSIYAATERVIDALGEELASYKVKKGTIRFPLSEPVPVQLIQHIARFRAKEIADVQMAKAAAKQQ